MPVSERLQSILVCPEDRGPLLLIGDEAFYNPRLRKYYRIDGGIPVLLVDDAVTIDDDAEHERLVAQGVAGQAVQP